jgi:cellulose synthase/poly-beta-1,6-N-acetylglucosamine synthase-like glycosyltransferase
MQWLNIAAWLIAIMLSIPLLVLAVECIAALLPWTHSPLPDPTARPRCAVLIPAHNEEFVLALTLQSVASQLGPSDRVLVVADNCTDGTAEIARQHGAHVVERTDPDRRGKGYALAFGREVLNDVPPELVVVLDADCTLGPSALLRLVSEASKWKRPVQANYQMIAPAEAGPNRQVAAFAFLVKNFVRPLGLRRLGQSCLLTGTGTAFPWRVFRDAPLAHGHIVEDMGLTVDLALAGRSPLFVPGAEVYGEFPVDERAADSQRRRWEHGHLQVIMENIPRVLVAVFMRGRISLLALALDIGVPPLSALMLATGVLLAGLGIWTALGGAWGPVAMLGGALSAAVIALFAVWWRYGRGVLPAGSLARIPLYAAQKIPLYLGFVVKPQKEWVRTARDKMLDNPQINS